VADRTVVVRLLAEIGQYQQQMAAASRSTDRLAKQTQQTERQVRGTLGSIRGMITTFGVPLVGAALVKSFMDFEQQMARVKAVGDPFGKSTEGARRLHDMALEAGQAYGFTANEVGLAMEELAKAGVKTDQIIGGVLNSALTLAAAGSIGLADAAKHIAVIQSQFDLTGLKDPTRIADQLARAANATVSGVNEMATSLSYVGPVAHSMGMNLEDTVATISLFNRAGLDADMAGTTLRGLLTSLTSPSHLAAMEMAGLNLELYNADGRMKNVYEIADEMKGKLDQLTPAEKNYAIGRIASNAQLQGALILMKAGGKGIDDMRKLIMLQASAEDVAREKTASFTGEVKNLGAAIESSMIKSMERLIPLMEPVVKMMTGLATGFGDMGGAAQLAAVALGAQLIMARRISGSMGSYSGAVRKAAQDSVALARASETLNQRLATPGGGGKDYEKETEKLRTTVTELRKAREETGRVKLALADTSVAMGNVSGAASKAAAGVKGSMSIIRASASNVMDFVGGGPAAAFAGWITAIGIVAATAEKAKARQKELTDTLVDLGAEYRKFGTYTGEAAQELINKDRILRDVAAHTKQYGVAIGDVVRASAGEVDQQRKVIAALKQRREEAGKQAGQGWYATMGPVGAIADLFDSSEAERFGEKIDELIPSLEDSYKLQKEIAEATKAVKDAGLAEYLDLTGKSIKDVNPEFKTLWENANILASEQVSAADKTNALKSSLDLLHGSLNSVSDAMGAFRGTSFQDTFFKTTKGTEGQKATAGRLVKDYKDLYKTVKTKARWETEATGALDAKGKAIYRRKFVPAGTKQVKAGRQYVGSHREGGQAAVAGTQDAVTSLFKANMLDPLTGQFRTLVKVNGQFNEELTQASIKMNAFLSDKSRRMLDVINAEFTTATASGAEFGTAAMVAGFRYAQLRKELTDMLMPIIKNEEAVKKLVNAYIPIPENIATTFSQPGMEKVLEDAGKLGIVVEQIPGSKDIYVTADTAAGRKALEDIGLKTRDLKDGRFGVQFTNWKDVQQKLYELSRERSPQVKPQIIWPKPTERVPEPSGKFRVPKSEKLFQGLEYAVGVKATMTVDGQNVEVTGKNVTVQIPKQATRNRWGGLYQPMAGGGLREAKLVKGGRPLYQWAEHETGGEAFIPRLGNPARSLSILDQAAAWYGQQVVPAGRLPAAAGASRPAAPAGARAASGAAAPAPITQVRVFLGNEELTDRVKVIVDERSSQSALQAAWGRRA
jgi:TP901 family phage tail tape measure protein